MIVPAAGRRRTGFDHDGFFCNPGHLRHLSAAHSTPARGPPSVREARKPPVIAQGGHFWRDLQVHGNRALPDSRTAGSNKPSTQAVTLYLLQQCRARDPEALCRVSPVVLVGVERP